MWAVVTEPSGPEVASLTTHCHVSPPPERRGPGLPLTVPHLAGINATLRIAGTEHLGFDLVPVKVGAVADITADYGDSGLLEYPRLLAWGCASRAGRSWGACTPPFLPGAHPGSLVSLHPWATRPSSRPTALPQPGSESPLTVTSRAEDGTHRSTVCCPSQSRCRSCRPLGPARQPGGTRAGCTL